MNLVDANLLPVPPSAGHHLLSYPESV